MSGYFISWSKGIKMLSKFPFSHLLQAFAVCPMALPPWHIGYRVSKSNSNILVCLVIIKSAPRDLSIWEGLKVNNIKDCRLLSLSFRTQIRSWFLIGDVVLTLTKHSLLPMGGIMWNFWKLMPPGTRLPFYTRLDNGMELFEQILLRLLILVARLTVLQINDNVSNRTSWHFILWRSIPGVLVEWYLSAQQITGKENARRHCWMPFSPFLISYGLKKRAKAKGGEYLAHWSYSFRHGPKTSIKIIGLCWRWICRLCLLVVLGVVLPRQLWRQSLLHTNIRYQSTMKLKDEEASQEIS